MTAPLLACQAVVAQVATTDRVETADRVLHVGVITAVALIREGRFGRAEYVLERARISADRILGDTQNGATA